MARATRSTTTQEKDKTSEPAQTSRKGGSKKRKRTSVADGAEQPASKQLRADDEIKEETSPDPEEPLPAGTTQPELPSSGDVPIHPEDAEKILEILEMVDTQGLLDRVFPLPTEHGLGSDSAAGPSTGTQSYSFRALLKSPSLYPLRVLRSAIQHLLPISSHPRSRPSAPAAEQLRFCNLTYALLDQASFRSSPIPLGIESLTSHQEDSNPSIDGEEGKPRSSYSHSPTRQHKYALVQRLPTGDWWSSTSSSYPSLGDGKELKDMPTAYAELVAIFATPSSTVPEVPTLGAYVKKSLPKPHNDLTAPRQVTCGRFLEYGPYASFAPVFEQEGVEIGRVRLGETIWYQERERRRRKRRQELEELHYNRAETLTTDTSPPEDEEVVAIDPPGSKQKDKMADAMDVDSALDGLLSPDAISSLKATLGSLELENAVQELLDRNARALKRLEELQLERLGSDDGGTRTVEVGSEEWEIAENIYNSLTLLASLRPRASTDADVAPLVPTAAALRKLHRTLPVGKTEGWYGTLPAGCGTTLRDDTTIHIKSGATVVAPVPIPAPAVAAAAAPPAAKTPAPGYGGYAYSGYPSTPYRSSYGSYAPAQTSSYYSGYSATAQTPTATQYPSQYGTTGPQPYSFSSWYNYQPPPPAVTSATPSGRATPATPTATAPANYPPYYPAAGTQQQPQRAVANTVLSAASSKTYQQGGWTNGTTTPYVPPTLPPHLRAATSTPGTPAPATGTVGYQAYYAANYQAPPTAAR